METNFTVKRTKNSVYIMKLLSRKTCCVSSPFWRLTPSIKLLMRIRINIDTFPRKLEA